MTNGWMDELMEGRREESKRWRREGEGWKEGGRKEQRNTKEGGEEGMKEEKEEGKGMEEEKGGGKEGMDRQLFKQNYQTRVLCRAHSVIL